MRMAGNLWMIGLLGAMLSVVGCGKKAQGPEGTAVAIPDGSAPDNAEEKQAICLYDGVALREDPNKNGKWLASIALGEVVKDLGESQIDAADKNRAYQRVELSDGKTGWAASYGLALNAKLAAVKNETVIYKRPDLVTGTDLKLEEMALVAVIQEKANWIEFAGEERKKSGWIRKDSVVYDPNEVAVAVLAAKKLKVKDPKEQAAALKNFVDSCPYPDTNFVTKLRDKLLKLTEAPKTAAEEPTERAAETATP